VKVEFKGGKELEAALKQFGSNATKRNIAERALKLAAQPIRDEWERLAPEDEGDLKSAIKIGRAIKVFQKGSRGDIVQTFVGVDEAIDKRLHIYAEVVEFGNDRQPPQPSGRPAWESQKTVALDRLADDLKIEIEKAAKRSARKAAKS
jgi:HK97 gp10 family phage protein